jgi:CHRD domain
VVAGVALPAFASHIHYGGAASTGPVAVPLKPPYESGSAPGCVVVERRIVAEILARRALFYVNVHTSEHAASAIRGQLR